MTLQYAGGAYEYPYLSLQQSTAPGFSNVTIDADGEAMAFICQVPKTGLIRTVGVRTAVVTTGGDLDFRIETVDSGTGDPSGSLYGTNTNIVVTFAGADDNVWKEGTLTADANVTAGDVIAVVLKRVSGTFAGNIAIPNAASTGWNPYGHSAYHDANASGTWTKSNLATTTLGIMYSDGSCFQVYDMVPITSWSALSYGNGSSPDEYGNRFRLPFPTRIVGCRGTIDADGDFVFKLYDDSGSQLATTNTIAATARSQTSQGRHTGIFTSPVSLSASTWYRATILPNSATTLSARKVGCNAAAWLACLGAGTEYYQCSRTDAGAFTDVTTDRVLMSLLLDQFDDGAGGGGGKGPLVGSGRLIRN